jgi:signal transduction histidine kinase
MQLPLKDGVAVSDRNVRIAIVGILIVVSVVFELVMRILQIIDIDYTHFFYVLIVIVAIWFQRKAIWVALFLAAMHLTASYMLTAEFLWGPLFQASMFVLVAILVTMLSEEKEKCCQALLQSRTDLEKKNAALIGFMVEYTQRMKNPMRISLWNLLEIRETLVKNSGVAQPETLDSLQVQIKNMEQILENLQLLTAAVVDGSSDIPDVYREFLTR